MQLMTAYQPWKCSFHSLTTQDPFPGSFWRSVCGSNYEMTRVVMGSEGETCLSIFWLKTNHKKYRKVSVHVFRTSQRCAYSSFPCKILVSFLVKLVYDWTMTFTCALEATTQAWQLTAKVWGLRYLRVDLFGGSLTGTIKKPKPKLPNRKRWILTKKFQIGANQLLYPIFFSRPTEKKTPKDAMSSLFEATNSWHRCFCEAHLEDMLILFIWSSTIRFWYTYMNVMAFKVSCTCICICFFCGKASLTHRLIPSLGWDEHPGRWARAPRPMSCVSLSAGFMSHVKPYWHGSS